MQEMCSITLAAGPSSRMPEDMRPKACCRIGTVSAIENLLNTYEAAGIDTHVVVVGPGGGERIMQEVAAQRRNVLFAFQPRAHGTGDAVRCAFDVLDRAGAPRKVIISAGDKILVPHVVRDLVATAAESDAALCLAAGRSEHYPDSGRIIERDGNVIGILEVPDLQTRRLAFELLALENGRRPKTLVEVPAVVERYFPNPTKFAKCLPAVAGLTDGKPSDPLDWRRVRSAVAPLACDFELRTGRIPVDEAADAPWSNIFVYVGNYTHLDAALHELRPNNAQGEFYLTDLAEVMAHRGQAVRAHRVSDPHHVMSFNTLPQLESIRSVYAQQYAQRTRYPTLAQWMPRLKDTPGDAMLHSAAGELAVRVGADRPALLVRSPGRINLMGRHIDHQGGTCNVMAIDREIVMVAAPRDDDRVNLWNGASDDYAQRSFRIGDLLEDVDWDNWLRTLDTQFVQRVVSMSAGDWGNYVKGAALRLQHRFSDRRIRGMDVFVQGNIPVAAGLSSSSALLVGASEALVAINGLNVRVSEFVDLCGEGEWFTGTRGGSADHAAIKHGRSCEVLTTAFHPFRILGHHPFPANHQLLVCHSGIFAKKTENARESYNARVASYHMARECIRRAFPRFADRIEHLRDVNTRHLELSLPGLYAVLKQLPNDLPPDEVWAMAEEHPTVAKALAGVDPAKCRFPLRDMAFYGLAECERAAMMGELLDRGDAHAIGRMMDLSHDGDRVARWCPNQTLFDSSVSEEAVDALIGAASRPGCLREANAALWLQRGAYDCSTPEIDRMVDLVVGQPGVRGAQISGAGLGGCIMVLLHNDAVEPVRRRLIDGYYAPREVEPITFVCRASQGSRVLARLEDE